MTGMSTNRIGVIGLPALAAALADLGFEVIYSEKFVDTARDIRHALQNDSFPILVEDRKQMGLPQLLSRIDDAAQAIVIVRAGSFVLPESESWSSVSLPATLGDVLQAGKLSDESGLFDDLWVDESGSLLDETPELPTGRRASPGDDADGNDLDSDPQLNAEPSPAPDTSPVADDEDSSDLFVDDDDDDPASQPVQPQEVRREDDDLFGDDDDEIDVSTSGKPDSAEQEPLPTTESPVEQPFEEDFDEDDEEDFDAPLIAPARVSSPVKQHAMASLSPEAEKPAPKPSAPTPQSPDSKLDDEVFGSRRVVAIPATTDEVPVAAVDRESEIDFATGEYTGDAEENPREEDTEDDGPIDTDDLVDALSTQSRRRGTRSFTTGMLMVTFAGKGGVGKSTITLTTAQMAAEVGGLSVCVIDANRGQADISKFLRTSKSNLPTIFEAAQMGNLDAAIITPEQLDAARAEIGDKVMFSLVQGPKSMGPEHDALISRVVTGGVYRQVIERARALHDLVIVDTQITESFDTSEIIDNAVIPSLNRGGFAMGVAEQSVPGVENLKIALRVLLNGGVPSDRVLTLVNKLDPKVTSVDGFTKVFGRETTWLGAIYFDARIRDDINSGRIPYDLPSLSPVVGTALHKVTGMTQFLDAIRTSSGSSEQSSSWWRRLLGRTEAK